MTIQEEADAAFPNVRHPLHTFLTNSAPICRYCRHAPATGRMNRPIENGQLCPYTKPMTIKLLTTILLLAGRALSFSGEIAEIHHREYGDKLTTLEKSRSHAEVESTKHGITEIGLERTPCY